MSRPVSRVCPRCGSADFEAGGPRESFSMGDRACRSCGTHYVPALPTWLAVVAILGGTALMLVGTCGVLRTAVDAYPRNLAIDAGICAVIGITGIRLLLFSIRSLRAPAGAAPGFQVLPPPAARDGNAPPHEDD